jgi:hypothetical protein
MRTYEEAFAAARDEPAFSNGTEGYGWMENWCWNGCLHEAEFTRTGEGTGCPLVLVALMQRTPSEWLDGPRDEQGRYSIADQYHCVEFRDEDNPGPGYGTPPDPPLPGQELLFDVAPHTRMYADMVIRPVEVTQ